MRAALTSLFLSCGFCVIWAQSYTISTVAGGGLPVNIPAASAGLLSVSGVALDSAGNVFLSSPRYNAVFRLDALTGVLTLAAGNGIQGSSGDNGPATSAELSGPSGLAVDPAGSLYIADTNNNSVRKVSSGAITTVAHANGPYAVAVSSVGDLYISDLTSNITKVSNGLSSVAAGNGMFGFSGDNGPATSAALANPRGIAVDAAGSLYIADTANNRIRKVSNGVITTVAGNGTPGFSGDNGPAASAGLNFPWAVAIDVSGNLYITETGDNRVRKVSKDVITTVAGNGISGSSGDNGPAISAALASPMSLAVDSAGNLYISTFADGRVRKVSNGVITTITGGGVFGFSGDNGPATSAQLHQPNGVAVDASGNLYIADSDNNRIRKVSNGVITTVAGNGTSGFSGDNGPAVDGQFSASARVAAGRGGEFYIGDWLNHRVRKVSSSGIITTIAGTGEAGSSGDNGPALNASLTYPMGMAVDPAGNLYVADSGANVIRKVSNGIITTVAGTGTAGFSGDGGPATSAQLDAPLAVALDSAGNLYIEDLGSARVRMVSNGVITTIAGNGTAGAGGDDGPAINAQLDFNGGLAVDAAGNVFITGADINLKVQMTFNSRVRRISSGVITTIAGQGVAGFSGDNGPATSALLNLPVGVAVDPAGNVYIADQQNDRIRMLTPTAITITNAASFTPQISPGSIAALWGNGNVLGVATAFGSGSPLPTSLNGTSVSIGGIPCPLLYVSPGQVNFQVPMELRPGTATLLANNNGQTLSTPVTVAIASPGIFSSDYYANGGVAVLQDSATFTNLDANHPAAAGENVTLYFTGIGPVANSPATGQPAGTALSQVTFAANITVGGVSVQPSFVGLTPGFVGLGQVNFQLPQSTPSGTSIPLVLTIADVSSRTAHISVR
jgi:uncharacterized protein (TIGR03437 family)